MRHEVREPLALPRPVALLLFPAKNLPELIRVAVQLLSAER